MDRRHNNFDLLRLVAAWLVLFSHCYPLTGQPAGDPFGRYVGIDTFGGLGVTIFFVLSGYLVTQSWDRSGGVVDFLWKRVRRIYPALVVCVLLCVCVLGPAMTTLDFATYLTHPQTRDYLNTASAWRIHHVLPGVFSDTPYPNAINGSLWSLPYEIRCYVVLLLIGVLPLALRWKVLFLTVVLTLMLLLRPASPPASAFDHVLGLDYYAVKLGLFFALGATYSCWRHRVKPLWWLGFLLLPVVFFLPQSSLRVTLYLFAAATAILGLALHVDWLPRLPEKMGDWSYGLYLYAFPVQQLASHFRLHEQIGFAGYVLACTAIALAAAAMSWFIVERRWLVRQLPVRLPSASLVAGWIRGDSAQFAGASKTVAANSFSFNSGLAALSLLRFAAALIVVIFHFGLVVEPLSKWPALHGLFQGPVAVSGLFVLSGFMLTTVYATALLKRDVSARQFWKARLVRIYPIYFFGGLLAVLLLKESVSAFGLFSYASLLQAWMPPQALAVNGVGWAISVEVACFALFPWVLRRAAGLAPGRLLVVAVVAWLLTLLLFCAALFLTNPPYPSGRHNFLYLFPIWHFHEFFMGIAGALLLRSAPILSYAVKWSGALCGFATFAVVAVLLVWPNPAESVGLLSPMFAMMIVGTYCLQGRLSVILQSAAARLLGDASYAIFMLQMPVIVTGMALLRKAGYSPAIALAVSITTLVLLSTVVTVMIDQKLRAWMRRAVTS